MSQQSGQKRASATIYVQQAKLEEAAGQFSKAIELYSAAIDLKGEASPAWWHARLAQAFILVGDHQKARKAYTEAIKIDPSNDAWQTATRELERWGHTGGGSIEASAGYYDDIYEKSASYRKDGEDTSYRQMWERIVDLLTTNGSRSILDIGCGPGQFAAFLAKRFKCEYLGMDFSSVAVRQATERKLPFTFAQGNALTTSLVESVAYDTVICTEVLEHVDKDLELISWVRSGTFCIFSVPSFYAFGHVRYFKTSETVTERYGPSFDGFSVEKFVLPSTESIFLFHGIKTS
ncbi:tetratricopeptide repeat protein [Pseudaminobacter salicylatoxidans]|uniref:Tetratricopeptide repeat protein n=1 Tax=Pseudaminobacter salicylatoxidans TaxID=93369 RepID=A0A316CMK8_PSESE|nr:methyltransferase domain-containing protein [Pseudaminobacter salicylatoxidans]PWJ81675.1 tetratricopeptide repeat protein [Pseudaminobacter salicylatoxidans]